MNFSEFLVMAQSYFLSHIPKIWLRPVNPKSRAIPSKSDAITFQSGANEGKLARKSDFWIETIANGRFIHALRQRFPQ